MTITDRGTQKWWSDNAGGRCSNVGSTDPSFALNCLVEELQIGLKIIGSQSGFEHVAFEIRVRIAVDMNGTRIYVTASTDRFCRLITLRYCQAQFARKYSKPSPNAVLLSAILTIRGLK